MKVIVSENGTVIYPFVKPDSEVVGFRERIEVWPDGTMSLFWSNKVRLDAEAARHLVEALQKAVELTESSLTYQQRQGPEWVEPGRGES